MSACSSFRLSLCFVSETSEHICLDLLPIFGVESDFVAERFFNKVFGFRSIWGNSFKRLILGLLNDALQLHRVHIVE